MKIKSTITLSLVIVAVSMYVLFLQKSKWYSASNVANHSDVNSCWTSINGSVYDVTTLAKTHTGGETTILQVCGKDGSSIFDKRHGEESGVVLELENYKIGTIH